MGLAWRSNHVGMPLDDGLGRETVLSERGIMIEHSPTPWKLTPDTLGNIEDANGRAIMQAQQTKPIRKAEDHAERLANAEITVRAVNSHDDLLAALKELMGLAQREGWIHVAIQQAQEAIAAAENRATIQSAGGGKW